MRKINQLGTAIMLATYGMHAQAAVENAGHIDLGPVEMVPMVSAGIGYDDNVYREGSGSLADIGSTIFQLDAEAEFRAQTGLNTYSATLAARNTSYASQSVANFTDLGVLGDIHQEFNSRNRLDAQFDLGRYHDAGSTVNGDIDKSAPAFDRTQGRLNYGFGAKEAQMRADLFGSINKQKYRTGGEDKKITEFGATGYYRVMPKTSALVEIKQRQLDYTEERGAAYDITSYLVGLDWEATGKSTGFAKLGRRYRDASGIDRQGYTGWEVGVSYQPVDYSLIQLSTIRDYGLESDDPADADFTQGTTTLLSWKHQWTDKITTRANYRYTSEEVQNSATIAQVERTVKRFGMAIDWNIRHNVNLSLTWQETNRNERAMAAGADPDSYQRSYYLVSATIAL